MWFKTKKTSPKKGGANAAVPKHIGIIMDGNGRWAQKRGLPRTAGHKKGADTLERIIEYCDKIGVKAVTAYAFSTENWSRPKEEVDAIMDMLYNYLLQADKKFGGRNIRFRVIGDLSRFDDKFLGAIRHAEEITAGNDGIIFNIALNYGGRREIAQAASRAARDAAEGRISPERIDEDYLAKYMYLSDCPSVDLIIRPSGEYRLSNFLLWEAAYAELWFSDTLWPDFSERDLDRAVEDFAARNRRFGGI